MMTIICQCGHEADYDEFRKTPLAGELPRDHFQCPACRRAWKLVTVGKPTIGWSGMVIPAKRRVVPAGRSL